MADPVTLVALGGVSAVLALIGPFGTGTDLPLFGRAIYWLAVVVGSFLAGSLVQSLTFATVTAAPLLVKVGLAAVCTGAVVSLFIVILNKLVFGYLPEGSEWLRFLSTVCAICLVVSGVLTFASVQNARSLASEQGNRPSILERLPLEKRGTLLALSVEDHYVRVITSKGEEMVLMRLSDAIRETVGIAGTQVHRSHWVAFDQVIAARKESDRAILTLSNGSEVPVSRANVPAIREAGLLPR